MASRVEVARVEVLDLELGPGPSSGGRRHSRPATEDCAESARRAFQRGRAAGVERIRLEWAEGFGTTGDPFDPDSAQNPPPWLDVIIDLGDGALALVRLTKDADAPSPVRTRATVDDPSGAAIRLPAGVVASVDRAITDFGVSRFIGRAWRAQVHRPGRGGRMPIFFAEKAAYYQRALERAPGRPIAWLVEQAAARGEHETPAMWRAWLGTARKRGLLTAAAAGKPGGTLTRKAEDLLRAADNMGGGS